MKLAAWDIETLEHPDFPLLPPDWVFASGYTLPITCAAVATSDGDETLVVTDWYYGNASECPEAPLHHPSLDPEQVRCLLYDLQAMYKDGYRLITVGGTNFDWRVLAGNTGEWELCAKLAMQTYDPTLQVLCQRGFPVGLEAMLKGFGLPGKLMSGSSAAWEWALDPDRVVRYVQSDAEKTLQVAQQIIKWRGLRWVTKDGEVSFEPFLKFMPASQCLRLPEPDVGWMGERIATRESMTDWIMEALK